MIVNDTTTIPTAETTYADLEDQAKAQIVITKIAAIGEVKYPTSIETIQEARTAYEELTVPQKEMVENYDVLTSAETKYAELEAEANAKKGLSGGAIAGIVIGCFFGLLLIAFIVLFILYKRDQKKEDDKKVIKVAAINNVMVKVEAFFIMIGTKVKALWNKLFKKNEQPAAGETEALAELPSEQAANDEPKEDNE